jgi:hypothetical protein
MRENEMVGLATSYLIAARIFGFLWVNGYLKKRWGTNELAFEKYLTAEFAGMAREILRDGKPMSLLEFESKYGLSGVECGIETDLEARGYEWEKRQAAIALLKEVEGLDSALGRGQ